MKLVVVCEAKADFELASCLIVRSLRHHGPSWFEDLPKIVEFSGWSGSDRADLALWKEIEADYSRIGGRALVGRRRGPYSIPATKAVVLAEKETELSGLVLMVDLDHEGERRGALLQVREEAGDRQFVTLVATPDPKREAWVLHGFEPANREEQKNLESLAKSRGFDPRLEPHRLRDDVRRGATKRDIKQVLGELIKDPQRERRCLEETPLQMLEDRGGNTYLKAFLVEIRERLLPRLVRGTK